MAKAWTAQRRPFFHRFMMGRIHPSQDAALDVLDRLLFNQILVFYAYGKSERGWLARIIDRISSAVTETGATGLQAECLKHGVLCLMEILLSDDLYKLSGTGLVHVERPVELSEENLHRMTEHNRNFFVAFVIAMLETIHGNSMADAPEIASNLAEEFLHAPAVVRYRLVERCLAYEFQQAPLDCLSWLAKSGVILSAKFPQDKLGELPDEAVFARIGLLCEFEMMRNYIGRTFGSANLAGIILDNHAYKRSESTVSTLLKQKHLFDEQTHLETLRNQVPYFNTEMLHDAAYVKAFYARVSRFCPRLRILQGTLATWLGALGAVMVEIDLSVHHVDRALFSTTNNTGTITDNVAASLRMRGFTVDGPTLNIRHRELSATIFRQVQVYFEMFNRHRVAISPYFGDIFYYSVATNAVHRDTPSR